MISSVRRLLRWLIAPTCAPLAVAAAFILGNAAGVEAGTGSSVWIDAIIIFVVMGGVSLLGWLLRRVAS